MNQHKDAFALGWIAAIIRWFEDLVNLLSSPLLTVGLGIALVALLTDGQLLARIPILLYGGPSRRRSAWMRSSSPRGTARGSLYVSTAIGR
jgi:hypothetical protein